MKLELLSATMLALVIPIVPAAVPEPSRLRSDPSGCTLARAGGRGTIELAKDFSARGVAQKPPNASRILRPANDIALPGAPVRFDYQSADSASGMLYISHMNDGHVIAFDTRSRTVTGNIPDMPRVTGVWVVPALHKLYASVTGHHHVAIINLPSLVVRATSGPIGFPDGIAYAPESKRVFVSDESGGGELVIDGLTDSVIATIPLGGEAGNTKYDPDSGCILVAVQTTNEIAVIDPSTAAVVARFALAKGDHPHGMYIDGPSRLLFVANQGNATMEVIDLGTMQVADMVTVGEDPDVLAYDPAWHRLFVATEGGGLWAYQVQGHRLAVEGVLDLPHAHTVSVDPVTHLVYLPLQNLNGKPVLRILAGLHPGAGAKP